MNTITLHIGDVRDVMAQMPAQSVDLIVTSPPFLALRSYLPADHPDKHREIGSEATPAAYLDTLLDLTVEWRRLLTPTGSLCVELGDTYSGSSSGELYDTMTHGPNGANRARSPLADGIARDKTKLGPGWPLSKSLCGIPTLYAWSLAYGHNLLNPDHRIDPWRVRNLLTWTRPNPPVGALGDKFRPATSFVTVACTSDRRWFDLDAVRETPKREDNNRLNTICHNTGARSDDGSVFYNNGNPAGAPPLDWWDDDHPDWQPLHRLPTHPYKGAHYATFNPALPRRLIEAMCPREVCVVCGEARRRVVQATEDYAAIRGVRGFNPQERRGNDSHLIAALRSNGRGGPTAQNETLGWTDCGCFAGAIDPDDGSELSTYRPGITLDPFAGSGTTAIAAATVGRDSVLIDLDGRSVDLIRQRLQNNFRIVDEMQTDGVIRWTIAPASRHELGAIAAGQLSLFGDVA